jgi:hypothetical protein
VSGLIGAWAALFGVGVVLLIGLGAIARAQRPRPDPPPADQSDSGSLRADARSLAEHAARSREAAGRAAANAAETRERAAAAAAARDVAWHVQERAHSVYEAAWRDALAGRAAQPSSQPDGDERDVTRAALSAYRRGDLSVNELQAVWHRAGGLAPEQDVLEQAAQRAAAEERAARRAYDRAAAVARRAERIAYVAEVAAAALADEAAQSSAEAHEALLASRMRRRSS